MINGGQKPGLYARVDPSDPLSKALIGCWLFNEAGGNTIYDISRKGNNGTFTNSPTWSYGKFSNAINFVSASSQYIDIETYSDYDFPNTTFSVSFWLKTGTSSSQYILGKFGPANVGGWAVGVGITGVTGTIGVITKNTGASTNCLSRESVLTVSDNKWHHCVVVITTNSSVSASNTASIYVDGRLSQGSATVSGVSDATADLSERLRIGGRNTGVYYNGLLDNVRIYNRSLNLADRQRLFVDPFAGLVDLPKTYYRSFQVSSGSPTGTISQTLSPFLSSISGTTTVTGTTSQTLSPFVSSISGVSGSGVFGDMAYTLSNFSSSVSGSPIVSGSSAGGMGAFASDISGSSGVNLTLTAADVDLIWDEDMGEGYTARDLMKIMAAVLAGKRSGTGTGLEVFKGLDGSTDRVASTIDSSGNRTAVVVDGN
jgi:hypothetical protein